MPTHLQPQQRATLVYIAGTNFCGSTLLAFILGCNDHVQSLGQMAQLKQYVADPATPCTCGETVAACPFWNHVLAQTGYRIEIPESIMTMPAELEKGLLYKWLGRFGRVDPGSPEAYREFNVDLLRAVAESTGCRVTVDTSKLIHRAKCLLKAHVDEDVDVRLLYLIRDGRAVMGSYRRRGSGLWKAALAWRLRHGRIAKFIESHPGVPVQRVRYEDLCGQPEATVREICEFIGVPFNTGMLDFRQRIQHQLGGNPMRFESTRDIRLDEAWRSRLSDGERRLFCRIAGGVQRSLGYPCP